MRSAAGRLRIEKSASHASSHGWGTLNFFSTWSSRKGSDSENGVRSALGASSKGSPTTAQGASNSRTESKRAGGNVWVKPDEDEQDVTIVGGLSGSSDGFVLLVPDMNAQSAKAYAAQHR